MGTSRAEVMTATPEQIAEKLEMLAQYEAEWGFVTEARDLRADAALIRAQAERMKVLAEALTLITEMDGDQPARSNWDMLRIARAALTQEKQT